MTGHELRDAGKGSPRPGDEVERQVGIDRLVVQRWLDQPAGEKALELGGKDEEVAPTRIVERLDAKSIARENGSPRAAVPDRKTEHSAEPRREGGPEALIQVG